MGFPRSRRTLHLCSTSASGEYRFQHRPPFRVDQVQGQQGRDNRFRPNNQNNQNQQHHSQISVHPNGPRMFRNNQSNQLQQNGARFMIQRMGGPNQVGGQQNRENVNWNVGG